VKILFVTKSYYPNIAGGGEISLKLLAEGLAKLGHEVAVISNDGNKEEVLNQVNVNRMNTDARGIINKVKEICADFDIIHVYNMFIIDHFGRNNFCIPLVATLNNHPNTRTFIKGQYLKNIRRFIYNIHYLRGLKRIRNLIALSDTLKEDYLKRGFDSERISVIPNMVPGHFYKKHRKAGKKNIAYMGQLYKHKGIDLLIKAFAKLKNRNLRLLIGGFGKERGSLLKLAKRLKVKVEFVGKIDHEKITKFYDRGDIFVHPGRWAEPFGRSVIEVMARKRIVIVTDRGAPPKIVRDRRLIVEPGVESIHKCLVKLISDDTLRQKLIEKLYKLSLAYKEEKIIPRFEKLYTSLKKS